MVGLALCSYREQRFLTAFVILNQLIFRVFDSSSIEILLRQVRVRRGEPAYPNKKYSRQTERCIVIVLIRTIFLQ